MVRPLVCLIGALLLLSCGKPNLSRSEVLTSAEAGLREGAFARVLSLYEGRPHMLDDTVADAWTGGLACAHAEALLEARDPRAAAAVAGLKCAEDAPAGMAAWHHFLVGFQALREGHTEQAHEVLLRVAEEEAVPLSRVAAKAYNLLAYLERGAGRFAAAATYYRACLEAARASQETFTLLRALNNFGLLCLKQDQFDAAIRYLEEACALMGPAHAEWEAAQLNLGVAYSLVGHYQKAEQCLLQARDAGGGPRRYEAQVLGELGSLYSRKEDWARAASYWEQAYDLARKANDRPAAALWAGNLAGAKVQAGDKDGTRYWIRQAGTYLESDAAKLRSLRVNEGYLALFDCDFAAGRDIGAELLLTAEELGDPSYEWDAHVLLSKIMLEMGKEEAGLRLGQEALDIIAENPGMADPGDQVAYLNRLSLFYDQQVRSLMRRNRAARALQVAASGQLHMMRTRAPIDFEPVDLIDASRRTDALILVYRLQEDRSYLWELSRGEVTPHQLPPAADIERLVTAYLAEVDALADPLREGGGEALYHLLAAPLVNDTRNREVVIVPSGILHRLPFDILPTPAGRYWGEDTLVCVTPALDLYLQPRKPEPVLRNALLVGDPAYVGSDWPRLTGSAQELARIARDLQQIEVVTLSGAEAHRRAYFAADPGAFSMIHFATHAAINNYAVFNNAVILAPEDGGEVSRLTVHDLLDGGLENVQLVTVSACSSAGKKTYGGEGLTGFAYGFLWAGARHVVVAGWNIHDEATALLMDTFYRRLAAGDRPVQALQAAKLAMIARDDRFRKPFYWGAFQIYVR